MKKAKGKNVKFNNCPVIPAKAGIYERADGLLLGIREQVGMIEELTAEYNADVERIKAEYDETLKIVQKNLKADEKMLVALMKKERGTFFDGTDVLQLTNGALIHEVGDHVKIPKGALEKCKELKFLNVIKTVESLNREAIEKWTTEKLLLIGAERKPVESFSYDLKKEA
jgi:hypothetical protein